MAQKNATPSAEQGKVLKKHGLSPLSWLVVLLLRAFGVIPNLATVMVSEVITCVMSFFAGRLFEATNK